MYGLNIHLKSFKLNPKLASGNDKIRVSITTLPEKNKEAFVTEARQMNFVHHFFTINVTDQTQKIIFVFRKIEFFDDPIIASTIVHVKKRLEKTLIPYLGWSTIWIFSNWSVGLYKETKFDLQLLENKGLYAYTSP